MRLFRLLGKPTATLARFVVVAVLLGSFTGSNTALAAEPSAAAKAAFEQGKKFDKEKSRNKAAAAFATAAEQGHSEAQYKLGQYYRSGRGGLKKDAKKALEWFEKSANQGFVRAMLQHRGLVQNQDMSLEVPTVHTCMYSSKLLQSSESI